MSAAPVEFVTDTRHVKHTIGGLSIFVFVMLVLAGVIGRRPFGENVVTSVIIAGGLLSGLWVHGVLAMFERRYTISDQGVTLFRRGKLIEEIEWTDVKSVSVGNLRIKAHDGRKISFNLPPPVQRKIRALIQERLSSYETDR